MQEILLVMNKCHQEAISESEASAYTHKHALAISFDQMKLAHVMTRASLTCRGQHPRLSGCCQLKARQVRREQLSVDPSTQVHRHSHVRLQAASKTDKEWVEAPILDRELEIELNHTAPPEMARMDWKMFNAGSIGTSNLYYHCNARSNNVSRQPLEQ
jgi:hypothetical protein